jgi:drug/metabolite transporter (DMT)-like permease
MPDTGKVRRDMEGQARVSLRQRLGRFVALLGIVFMVTMAVVVTQRLSNDALALLIGVGVGVAALVPTLALGWLVLRREMTRQQAVPQHNPALNPPVVVVTPQALPGYGVPQAALPPSPAMTWQTAPPQHASQQRAFTIVGEEP